jgi:hypothetical protein
MLRGEHEPARGDHEQKPLQAFELPEALAEFLAGQEYAMLPHASDQGTVFVVKVPVAEISRVTGDVPVQVHHELYQHPRAPVIRTVVRIFDQPQNPLVLESFTNVDEEDQWSDFAQLGEQEELLFLFYDETLSHRLTKRVQNTGKQEMGRILNWADRIKAATPDEQYDFDAAKAAVMRRTAL